MEQPLLHLSPGALCSFCPGALEHHTHSCVFHTRPCVLCAHLSHCVYPHAAPCVAMIHPSVGSRAGLHTGSRTGIKLPSKSTQPMRKTVPAFNSNGLAQNTQASMSCPSDLIGASLCGLVLLGKGHPRLLMCALDREAGPFIRRFCCFCFRTCCCGAEPEMAN